VRSDTVSGWKEDAVTAGTCAADWTAAPGNHLRIPSGDWWNGQSLGEKVLRRMSDNPHSIQGSRLTWWAPSC